MANDHEVVVLTHADNRPDIEAELHRHPNRHRLRFEYVAMPQSLAWLRHSTYSLFNLHYYLWQVAAGRRASAIHRVEPVDLVQHISFMRWWMPSAGAELASAGVKFIFGPVVGGDLMPANFRKGIPLQAKLGELVRWLAREIHRRDPRLARTLRSADLVLAGTRSAHAGATRLGAKRVELTSSGTMSDSSLVSSVLAYRHTLPESRPFRFVSVGGLSYYRGVDLALRAFACANISGTEYVHACDGPDRHRLERLARELGIADRVRFTGDIGHACNLREVACGHVYVHTVLRDSMGVIPEAMALGLPVLGLDLNTMSLMIDDRSGAKIPVTPTTTPEDVVRELARLMKLWHDDAELRQRLAAGAQARSQAFTRAARASQLRAFQQSVLTCESLATPSLARPSAA